MLKQESFLKEIFYMVRLATKTNKKSLYSVCLYLTFFKSFSIIILV